MADPAPSIRLVWRAWSYIDERANAMKSAEKALSELVDNGYTIEDVSASRGFVVWTLKMRGRGGSGV